MASRFSDRRRERQLRWFLFLVAAGLWTSVVAQLGWLPVLAGVLVLTVLLLQVWTGNRIPALVYHSVSDDGAWLGSPFLVVPVASFRRQMQWLKRRGYTSLTLDQLYAIRAGEAERPRRPIVLNFDDGYLDSWAVVEPILRQSGLVGTVFVSTDWIEPGTAGRPQLDSARDGELQCAGYLNRTEIAELAGHGILDVQSHAVTHSRVPSRDRIVDYVSPDNQPGWLIAQLNPSERYNWFRNEACAPPGFPIFETRESLAGREYRVAPELIGELVALGAKDDFFGRPDWRQQLDARVANWRHEHGETGHYESEESAAQRWRSELIGSRQELEQITGKPVTHLCWPRNGYCRASRELALVLGYRSTTAGIGFNDDADPTSIGRIHIDGIGVTWLDMTTFVLQVWVFEGRVWAWPALVLVQKLLHQLQRRRA